MLVFAACHAGTTPARGDDDFRPAPEFTNVTEWLHTEPLRMADQRGRVVIVHFWTHGCYNCVNNYPHYRAWAERYGVADSLLLVGIHTPEFPAEKNVQRIQEQTKKHELTFPVAVDNDWANWRAWGNRAWPSVYLVDKRGRIRKAWVGELGRTGYTKMTEAIDSLLAEVAPNPVPASKP